jgi:cobalt-zinc-cadmium efflux system outer membrane protein
VSGINTTAGVGAGSLRDKTVDSTVRIDQVIERGDRRDLRLANARSLESASTEDLSDTQRQQRLALRFAYYDLLFAQDKVGITRDTIALFDGSVRAAELRLKAGDIAMVAISGCVDALRAQNDARAAEAEQRRAQLALAYMIGAEGRAIAIRAVDPWPSLYAGRPGGAVEDLIEGRPDVRAAKNRLEAAQNGRDLARSLRTRDVTVGAQYEHYPIGTAPANTFGTGNSYGVFVSVPIFAGYYYEGEIRRSEVDYSVAMEGLAMRAQARGDRQAFSDLQSAASTTQRYDESLLVEARGLLILRNSPTRTAR